MLQGGVAVGPPDELVCPEHQPRLVDKLRVGVDSALYFRKRAWEVQILVLAYSSCSCFERWLQAGLVEHVSHLILLLSQV